MELRAKQFDAIALLLAGKQVKEIAKALKITPRTFNNWANDPDFAAAYAAARTKVFNDALDRLQVLSADAVQALKNCLSADKDSDKIKAALGILGQAVQAKEVQTLSAELAAVRAMLEERGRGGSNGHHLSGFGSGMAARENGAGGARGGAA